MIKMQCPHCGFNNKINIEINERQSRNESKIITCDSDEGGCDTDFALYSTLNITAYAKPIVDALPEDAKES